MLFYFMLMHASNLWVCHRSTCVSVQVLCKAQITSGAFMNMITYPRQQTRSCDAPALYHSRKCLEELHESFSLYVCLIYIIFVISCFIQVLVLKLFISRYWFTKCIFRVLRRVLMWIICHRVSLSWTFWTCTFEKNNM